MATAREVLQEVQDKLLESSAKMRGYIVKENDTPAIVKKKAARIQGYLSFFIEKKLEILNMQSKIETSLSAELAIVVRDMDKSLKQKRYLIDIEVSDRDPDIVALSRDVDSLAKFVNDEINLVQAMLSYSQSVLKHLADEFRNTKSTS